MVTPFMSEVLEREEKAIQSTPAFSTYYVFAFPPPQKKGGIHQENWVYNSIWSLTYGRFADLFMPQWVWYNWNYVFIGNQ